jgi:hypothetical protein
MPKIVTRLAVAALSIGMAVPAIAQSKRASPSTQELAAQTNRPRITIYPRRYLPPNATRQCRSWLVKEYRVSGPVIVPQMRCWWEY